MFYNFLVNNKKMQKLYILDGSWYMYRAYHALPEITNKDWENMNAVFGFFRMVLKLFQNRPDFFVIAWDGPTKTLRHQNFPEYKANRPAIADDFKRQISVIKKFVKELNLNYYEIPWYEADDIIYSIANNVKNNQLQIYIESLDKDLKQLIDQNIFFSDSSKSEITDTNKFISEYWFEPKCIVDYLALLGDASDNIPGVKWIGKKTAQELIQKYISLDWIYENINNISTSNREKLTTQKELVYNSKSLIELYQIEDLKTLKIEELKLNVDFDNYKNILKDELWFKSSENIIENLKKLYQCWEQPSLF